MKIFSINQQNNTNFKSAYTKSYQSIKAIKGTTCACCGKEMIDAIDITKAFSAVSKPLSKMLLSGKFNSWSDKLPILSTLVKFAQKFPNDSFDKIFISSHENFKELSSAILATLPDNDPTASHRDLLNVRDQLINDFRSELKPARTTLKRFKTFRDKLKDKEKEIFDLLEYYADLNPRATLKEIINDPKILNFHKDIHIKHRIKNERIRNLHFNRIDKMIAKENPDAVEFFAEVRERGMQILLRDFDPEANLPNLKNLYKEALKQNGCERITNRVMDELKQMPIENIIADSFFGYAALKQLNDGEILEELLIPSYKTFEHIKARSTGGEDKAENGILLCKKCNFARSSIDYREFLEYHPYMPYHTQKQILQISDAILKGRVDGTSRYWPFQVATTLRENSGEKLNPDLTSYCKKSARKIKKVREQRTEQINAYNESIDAAKKEMEELRQRMNALTQDINATRQEVSILMKKDHKDLEFQEKLDSYLEEK